MRLWNLWLQIALECLHDCCHLAGLPRDGAKWQQESCMGLVLGRKPERETLIFNLLGLRPAMKGSLSHAQWVRLRFVVMFCCHVRSYMRVSYVMLLNAVCWLHQSFLALRLHAQYYCLLQLGIVIVLEWLHQCCDTDLSADFLNFGTGGFPFRIPFKKCFKIVFFALAPRSGFGAAISVAIMYKKASLCKTSFCKSLLCKRFCVKAVCKSSLCKNLMCVKAFCA